MKNTETWPGPTARGTSSRWAGSAIKVTRFLCKGCGFSEEWVEAPGDIAKLVDNYG